MGLITVKKKPAYRYGLLNTQEENPSSSVDQQQVPIGLIGSGQGGYDQNQLRLLYSQYMKDMQAQQESKDEQAMGNAALKTGKYLSNKYDLGAGTAGNAVAAKEGYGSLDHANYNKVADTIDDAGGAEATNPDAGSGGGGSTGGSYLGALSGALGGYSRGKKNYYTDPNMRNGKDGFGKYHRDYRAEVGGGVLGGVIGYFAPYLSGVTGPIVEAVHPYAEEITRNAINAGDTLGGATGAMLFDPIGTAASGKYSNEDIALSGLLAPLGPLNAFNSGSSTVQSLVKNPSPSNIGRKIGDFFGW